MVDNGPMTESSSVPGIRERNRRAITAEILAAARSQVSEVGASQLSLRAITRDLGMSSSALYRYFASRDELLTALLVEAYEDLARWVSDGDRAVEDRNDLGGRWMGMGRAMRRWALADPQRWGLLYGTPVIGYEAPDATTDSARLVAQPMLALASDAAASRSTDDAPDEPIILDDAFAADLGGMSAPVGEDGGLLSLGAWSHLIGLISIEVFGHLNNVVSDPDAHFEIQMGEWAARIQAQL